MPKQLTHLSPLLPSHIDYNLHIKPILSDRCFKCHGPDKNKIEAGLQLASYEGATRRLKSGARAIVPGDVGNSELVTRILSQDAAEVMPTPESHLTLSDEEKALIIKWIAQGAEYKEHWSLVPVRRPAVPSVGKTFLARWGLVNDDKTRWVKNDIDRFVLATLSHKGLKPSPEADKSTLLRRVSMDLTGLPPTPSETDAFLADSSSNAYDKVVDRLLASPHFGEQMAVSWLDLARYADSHGYQDDGMRNAYPYRDWVITAFNRNLSLDQFVTQQLAGDLLPNPTRGMLVATSFNRQHPQTQEGGIIPEEYRTEYVADRANTFGKAFLGLTVECARCHDHKYDPISQKDYYSLFAFFNQNKEFGMVPYNGEGSPTTLMPSPDTEKQIRFIQAHLARIEATTKPETYAKSFTTWTARRFASLRPDNTLTRELLVYLPLEDASKNRYRNLADVRFQANLQGDLARKPTTVAGKIGRAVRFNGDCGLEIHLEGVDKRNGKFMPDSVRYGRGLNFESNHPFSLAVWVNPLKFGSAGVIIQRSNFESNGWRGYTLTLNPDGTLSALLSYVWPANCIELKTREKLVPNQWQHVAFTYDGSMKAAGLNMFLNGHRLQPAVITDNLHKSILHDEKGLNFGGLSNLLIGLDDRRKTIEAVEMDEIRIYGRQLSLLEVESLASGQNAADVLLKLPRHSASQKMMLLDHYLLTVDSTAAANRDALKIWRGRQVDLLTPVPEVMVMQELPSGQQRKTFILNRGVYDAPGAQVRPETPQKLALPYQNGSPVAYPANRLGLARWLLAQDNPLFARVMANRFWQQCFGRGIVKTQEDFGNQGELPSHPELLDWLAAQFRSEQWNVKKFVRRLVLSATYRQSSKADAKALEYDPDNRWLARGSSYRFSAEQVRDNALAASGLLVRRIGGPSVYPYQPAGIWEALATRNVVSYRPQHGNSLYRRSLYTVWKRSSPPPMMLNFDAPDRSGCTVRRQVTATPLQALVTLNDPQFVEAARVLAQRTLRRLPGFEDRVAYFFQAALSRRPRATETAILKQLYQAEYMGFSQDSRRAADVLSIGEYPVDSTLDAATLAAYTVVANTIFNYDEALIKR